jgi:hypothetical protein
MNPGNLAKMELTSAGMLLIFGRDVRDAQAVNLLLIRGRFIGVFRNSRGVAYVA